MVAAVATDPKLRLSVRDMTGQKLRRIAVPRELTVGDVLEGVLPAMELPKADSNGRPTSFRARLTREGRYLNPAEIAGDAMIDEDELQITVTIEAGSAKQQRF